jgi:hypothetical protein
MNHNDNNDHHQGVLREDYGDKLDRILDIVSGTNERLAQVEADVAEMKPNVALIPAIKAAVTDQNRDLTRLDQHVGDHEQRLRSLEQSA